LKNSSNPKRRGRRMPPSLKPRPILFLSGMPSSLRLKPSGGRRRCPSW